MKAKYIDSFQVVFLSQLLFIINENFEYRSLFENLYVDGTTFDHWDF